MRTCRYVDDPQIIAIVVKSVLNKVHIREFMLSDYEQVVSLWLECELIRHKQSISKEMLQVKSQRDLQLFLVCEDSKGRLIGTVMGAWDGWRGWIYKLAVAKDHRRDGLGSRLVAEATRRLRESGATIVRAYVEKDNGASLFLFGKLGFSVMDDVVLVTLGRQEGPSLPYHQPRAGPIATKNGRVVKNNSASHSREIVKGASIGRLSRS